MEQTVPKMLFCMTVFLAFLVVSASLPQAQAGTISETRYFRGDDSIAFGNYGGYQNQLAFMSYQASDGTAGLNFTMTAGVAGNKKFQVGFRLWMTDGSIIPNETELTGGSPQAVITRDAGDTGIKALSAQWNCSLTNFNGNQTFKASVYKRYLIVGSTWSTWTLWTSPYVTTFYGLGLGYQTLAAATWNITYYTNRVYTGSTYLYFLVGNSTWNSHIEGITYDNGIIDPTESNNQYFIVGGTLGGTVIGIIIMGFYMANRKRKNQYVTEPSFSDS